jgi:methionine-rich copper-binding protein CopC
MARLSKSTWAIFFTVIACLNLGSVPAVAHSDLVSSDPAADSVLEAIPASILLTFSEDLLVLDGAQAGNQVIVTDSVGTNLEAGEPVIAANTISIALSPSDAQGLVTVTYRVVSADGHPIEGSYIFTVGQPMVISPSGNLEDAESNKTDDWTPIFLGIVAGLTAVALILILRRKNQHQNQ